MWRVVREFAPGERAGSEQLQILQLEWAGRLSRQRLASSAMPLMKIGACCACPLRPESKTKAAVTEASGLGSRCFKKGPLFIER